MRHIPLSLAALALAACGGGNVDPDARMPTPHPEGSDGSVTSIQLADFENAVTSTEVSDAAMEGEWTTTTIDRNPAAVFADAEGNRQLAVVCRAGGEEQGNSVSMLRYLPEDYELAEDSSVAIYTSAGSKAFVAAANPVNITTPVGDYFATMMSSARGDIRIIVDDTDVAVIPAGDAARQVVARCRPELEYQGSPSEDEDGTE